MKSTRLFPKLVLWVVSTGLVGTWVPATYSFPLSPPSLLPFLPPSLSSSSSSVFQALAFSLSFSASTVLEEISLASQNVSSFFPILFPTEGSKTRHLISFLWAPTVPRRLSFSSLQLTHLHEPPPEVWGDTVHSDTVSSLNDELSHLAATVVFQSRWKFSSLAL